MYSANTETVYNNFQIVWKMLQNMYEKCFIQVICMVPETLTETLKKLNFINSFRNIYKLDQHAISTFLKVKTKCYRKT